MTYRLEIRCSEGLWLARLLAESPGTPPEAEGWIEFHSPLALLEWMETQVIPESSRPDLP